MFITDRMTRVSIFLPREDGVRLWEKLGRFGALHPGELRRVEKLSGYLSFVDLSGLEARLHDAASFLNVDLDSPLVGDPSPLPLPELEGRMNRIEEDLTKAGKRRDSLDDERRALHAELDRLRLQRAHVEMLGPLEVDICSLGELKRFRIMTGTVPTRNLEGLERSLGGIPHALIPYRRDRHRTQLFAVSLPDDAGQVEKILRSALFKPIEVPPGLRGDPDHALAEIDRLEKAASAELEKLEAEIAEFERWREKKREELADFLKVNAATIAGLAQTGKTEAVALAIGWVPKRDIPRLKGIVADEESWVLRTEDLPYTEARDDLSLPIPGKLRNPPFFRAFEGLVRIYGNPAYGGFDPTVLFAGFYLLLFGMMFGDVGHGGILLLIGLLLRFSPRLRERFNETGTVLIGIGISSIGFGTLYGSVFGYEGIIPALWFRPMDAINRLLIYAVALGGAVIVTGIIVNIVSKLIRHRFIELFYERFGLLGLWFYLGGIGTVITLSRGRGLSIPAVFSMTLLPLILMPTIKGLTGRFRKKEGEETGFTGLIVAGVDLFEGLLVYLSNSISFVRVAAFALNHAALSLAIFQLARMLNAMGGGGALYVLTVAGGNLLILVLEGGIVGIQALRLEFYEFFSKFFEEEGTAYTPFKYNLVQNRR